MTTPLEAYMTQEQSNARFAQAKLIDEGAASCQLKHADKTDALLMITCVAAVARGATPLEIQRNINYYDGIE